MTVTKGGSLDRVPCFGYPGPLSPSGPEPRAGVDVTGSRPDGSVGYDGGTAELRVSVDGSSSTSPTTRRSSSTSGSPSSDGCPCRRDLGRESPVKGSRRRVYLPPYGKSHVEDPFPILNPGLAPESPPGLPHFWHRISTLVLTFRILWVLPRSNARGDSGRSVVAQGASRTVLHMTQDAAPSEPKMFLRFRRSRPHGMVPLHGQSDRSRVPSQRKLMAFAFVQKFDPILVPCHESPTLLSTLTVSTRYSVQVSLPSRTFLGLTSLVRSVNPYHIYSLRL